MIKKILMSFVMVTALVSTASADTVVVVEKPAPVQTVVVKESQPAVDASGAIIAGATAAVVGAALNHGHDKHGGKPAPVASPAPAPKPNPAPAPKRR